MKLALMVLVALVIWAIWRGLIPWPLPPAPQLPQGPLTGRVERLILDKSDRMLIAVQDGKPARVYKVALGFAPEGDKQREGDGKTPEGTFRIDRRNDRSAFHLSLGLDYPRPEDRARARAAGVSPGGDIFIHGQPNGRVQPGMRIKGDWTEGCVALSDAEMDELFAATPIGTEIEIRP